MDGLYIVFLAVGSVLSVLYVLVLLSTGNKYDAMVENLDKKEYRFSELYTFGFAVLAMLSKTKLRHSFSSKDELKRWKCINILKGEKYSEYYLNVEYAKRLSLTVPVVILSFIMVPFAEEVLVCPIMLVIAFALYVYMGRKPQKMIEERSEVLLSQFPEIVSKIALLFNSGMTISRAWEKVAHSGNGEIYGLMKQVCVDINNGIPETQAYFEFGSNSAVPELKKFASTIVQGMTKDAEYLSSMLEEQSAEVWSLKMNLVKRQGDAAVSKLIAPMMLIFIGILIMIVVPIFTNMGVN